MHGGVKTLPKHSNGGAQTAQSALLNVFEEITKALESSPNPKSFCSRKRSRQRLTSSP
jgi:hypothetical protein